PTTSIYPLSLHDALPISLRLEPLAQVAVRSDQTVFGAAGNPQQFQLLIRLGVKARKILVELVRHPARTEGTDPGKLVEIIQARQDRKSTRLNSSHRTISY